MVQCMVVLQEGRFTLGLRAVGSRDPAVHAMQCSLAHLFGVSPGTNLYLSPPGKCGAAALLRATPQLSGSIKALGCVANVLRRVLRQEKSVASH